MVDLSGVEMAWSWIDIQSYAMVDTQKVRHAFVVDMLCNKGVRYFKPCNEVCNFFCEVASST